MKYINLACGDTYIQSPEWINFDFTPHSNSVIKCDLLSTLPLDTESIDLIYCSHFLEHIPRTQVSNFLGECHRLLKKNAVIRLVLPDLENLCKEYLSLRQISSHDKADFVVIEMIDQCVRSTSGGELGNFYSNSRNKEVSNELAEFVYYRTGENILQLNPNYNTEEGEIKNYNIRFIERVKTFISSKVFNYRLKLGLSLLPATFRNQNVSLAAVGEKHHWLWDFNQLERVLLSLGFTDIIRLDCNTSGFKDFPLYPLDSDKAGQPRKGAESMYIEARKST